jgi:hypothetical protein
MLDEIIHPEVRTFFLVMVAGCAYAVWRGRFPERISALAILLAWISTQIMNTHDWTEPQYTIFVVDTVLLVILIGLALLSGRRWLMVATAFHVLTVADHVATMMDIHIRSYAYLTALVIWGYAVIVAMMLGTRFEAEPERRRLRAMASVEVP